MAAVNEKHPFIVITRQTIDSKFRLFKHKIDEEANGSGNDLSYFDRDRIATNKVGLPCGSLTSADDRKFLQGLAVARDNRNAGMS